MPRRMAPRITDRRRKPRPPAWYATRVDEGSLIAALTVEEIEEAVGATAIDWDSMGVAEAIVNRGLVDGTAVRGYWTGLVEPMSDVVRDPSGRVPHSWIVTPSGFVLDFTRWRFEQAPPYIYEGPADYYSEAGA